MEISSGQVSTVTDSTFCAATDAKDQVPASLLSSASQLYHSSMDLSRNAERVPGMGR